MMHLDNCKWSVLCNSCFLAGIACPTFLKKLRLVRKCNSAVMCPVNMDSSEITESDVVAHCQRLDCTQHWCHDMPWPYNLYRVLQQWASRQVNFRHGPCTKIWSRQAVWAEKIVKIVKLKRWEDDGKMMGWWTGNQPKNKQNQSQRSRPRRRPRSAWAFWAPRSWSLERFMQDIALWCPV